MPGPVLGTGGEEETKTCPFLYAVFFWEAWCTVTRVACPLVSMFPGISTSFTTCHLPF